MGFISINYDLDSNDSVIYENVKLSVNKKSIKFDSKDFIKDWYNALKTYINVEYKNDNSILSFSSSIDDFIMDNDEYDVKYLIQVDDKFELLSDDIEDKGILVFVNKNENPTWEELKNYCTT